MIIIKTWILYKHTNKINNKIYIGITCQHPPEKRWKNGLGYESSPHFYSAIKKYGWENFNHDIIKDNLSLEEANRLEIEYIKRYNTTNNKYGYNDLLGGDCRIYTKEMKENRSKKMKELWLKDTYKNKILNHLHCEEYKKEQSERSKKMWKNKETRERIINKLKGKKRSEETKKKLSEQKIGNKNPMWGKTISEETREKRRNNHTTNIKVKCIETGIIYRSYSECGRQMGLDASSISKVCRGELKHFHNYHFEKVE